MIKKISKVLYSMYCWLTFHCGIIESLLMKTYCWFALVMMALLVLVVFLKRIAP